MNYADVSVPYTRIHEPHHLHPEKEKNIDKTLIIKEHSKLDTTNNPYYPIPDQENKLLSLKYRDLANQLENIYISGRLGDYKYYDMHETIARGLDVYEKIKTWKSNKSYITKLKSCKDFRS